MLLQPKLPPGRCDRKAGAYHSEILRLRAEGYTFEAIRVALLDVGVVVGRTTIKREANRRAVNRLDSAKTESRSTAMPTWQSQATEAEGFSAKANPSKWHA